MENKAFYFSFKGTTFRLFYFSYILFYLMKSITSKLKKNASVKIKNNNVKFKFTQRFVYVKTLQNIPNKIF